SRFRRKQPGLSAAALDNSPQASQKRLKNMLPKYSGACFLILSCRAKPAAILAAQMIHFLKNKFWLILHNTELANAVPHFNAGIPGGINGHAPLVVVAAIAAVNHAHGIGLQNPPGLKRAGTGHHMGFV